MADNKSHRKTHIILATENTEDTEIHSEVKGPLRK
jgi:hypothetical protein